MYTEKVKLATILHAKDVYPNECCGVVTQKGRAQKYHRIDNVHRDPENHFEMDAQQYHDALEAGELIAVVHSHTGDGATTTPSAHDRAVCNEMGVNWIIVALPDLDWRVVEPVDSPLTGRPFALGSSDCYGLIMAWHKKHGITLDDFRVDYEWWKKEYGENIYQDNYLEQGFEPVNRAPKVGDMIIMQIDSPVWNHAGIYVGDNQMLHHSFGKLSRIDLYSGWYQERTVMVCRHKDLPDEIES